MASKPWLTVFSGIAIRDVALATKFIANGPRDALDPKRPVNVMRA